MSRTSGGVRWTRRLLVTAGTAALAYGAYGAVSEGQFAKSAYRNFLAASLLWPLLLAVPAALGVGALLARRVPGAVRPALQAALFVTAVVLIPTLPLLIGTGHDESLPSALPRAYGWGLALVLGAVWGAATVWAAVRVRAVRG